MPPKTGERNLTIVLAVIFLVVFVLILIVINTKPAGNIRGVTQTAPSPTVAPQTGRCLSVTGLPDKNCTPGSTDPSVSADNIQSTICKSGYTASVRPPASYTNKLKLQQIIDYGYADTDPSHYEEDHLISLELGGSPTDPKNLWPEPSGSPNPKDKVENFCRKLVCQGRISLKDAQQQIAAHWPTACGYTGN